jgi:succinate dehydrogenase / fumarate reductase flavoprotein subunit
MTDTMSSKFVIFREEQKMQLGLGEIKKMQERVSLASPQNKERQLNQALVRFLELEGMLLLAEAVARGALAREESRGSHTRTDYRERDDRNFLKHTLVGLRDETMYVSYKPVTLGMFEPRERVY